AKRPPLHFLERNFVVVVELGARCGRAGRFAGTAATAAVAAATTAATFVVTAAIEHLHRVRDDLGAVLFLARLFVVPAVSADRAFDVNELSLAQVLPANLRELAPRDDVVPLRPLLLFAAAVGDALIGLDPALCDIR